MTRYIDYEDYDDDSFYGEDNKTFQKMKSKPPKKKFKGHQSRHGKSESDLWENIETVDTAFEDSNSSKKTYSPNSNDYKKTNSNNYQKGNFSSTPKNTPAASTTPIGTQAPGTVKHEFGPNTREIKGNKIDMDGVLDIVKVENLRDGVMTYGIKFCFKGKKGLSRTIWFNINERARNITFNTEYAFWQSVKETSEGK